MIAASLYNEGIKHKEEDKCSRKVNEYEAMKQSTMRFDFPGAGKRALELLHKIDKVAPGTIHKGARIAQMYLESDCFGHFEKTAELVRSYLDMVHRAEKLFFKAWDGPLTPEDIHEYNFLVTALGLQDIAYTSNYLYYNNTESSLDKEEAQMKIRIIPADPRRAIRIHKKVAAYCRVSTQQEIQFHSLEAQAKYFNEFIRQHPHWELIGIYADQASGRNNIHMKEFQRMMEDCRAGKIDLILVKSISRLGRNTVQFLQACDMLNALRVDVYFEIEKLYISDPKAVKMMTIYASLYQHESESKSYATRWGIVTRFQDGSSKICDWPCYGYRKTENGDLVPDQEEATVVRQIYRWNHDGNSLRDIAARLIDMQIPCPGGGMKWYPEMVRRILSNEKYRGDVMLQKTYVADYFTGKRAINRGEYDRYLIKGHHEAIIEDKAKG